MPNEIDYVAVLADLEAKRADIDKAIAGVRQLLSLGSEQGTSINTERKDRPTQIRSDSFSHMPLPSAILKLLDMVKRPLSKSEVTTPLINGGFKTTSENFSSMVSTNLSRLKADGELVNVDGKWGLASWYPSTEKIQPKTGVKQKRDDAKSPLTMEQIERIKQLNTSGKPLNEIARELDVHHLKILNSHVWRTLHPK